MGFGDPVYDCRPRPAPDRSRCCVLCACERLEGARQEVRAKARTFVFDRNDNVVVLRKGADANAGTEWRVGQRIRQKIVERSINPKLVGME